MANIHWFTRGDGVLYCAEEGTASYDLFTRSSEFTLCDGSGSLDTNDTNTEQPVVADRKAAGDARQGGTSGRSGTRGRDKGNDNQKHTARTDVSAGRDNKTGVKSESGDRAKKIAKE